MIKKKLKILNFETGKPDSKGLFGWDSHLVDRINRISQEIHQNTLTNSANWIVTGSQVSEALNDLIGDVYGPGPNNYGRTELLGIDQVGDDPTQLSVSMSFEPIRTLQHVDLDFTITPTGANINNIVDDE